MLKTFQTLLNDGNPTDTPMRLGQLNFGDFLASFAKGGEADTANRAVTTHVHEFADATGIEQYGVILSVRAVAGGVTGPMAIVETGTPLTGQVKVESAAGRPKLTFAAGDAVTACRCRWVFVPRCRNGNSWVTMFAESTP